VEENCEQVVSDIVQKVIDRILKIEHFRQTFLPHLVYEVCSKLGHAQEEVMTQVCDKVNAFFKARAVGNGYGRSGNSSATGGNTRPSQ
jgi:hypothetical protein